uniref:Uncharacterized protein n=1 Tax=Seriola lalandi dorsalis TaxID=1841481 RepID=A0A3B4YKI3_SERLL
AAAASAVSSLLVAGSRHHYHPPTLLPPVSPGRNRCNGCTGNSHSSHIKVLLSNSANGACSVKQALKEFSQAHWRVFSKALSAISLFIRFLAKKY